MLYAPTHALYPITNTPPVGSKNAYIGLTYAALYASFANLFLYISLSSHTSLMHNFVIYLDYSILIVQGIQTEQLQD